VVILVAKNIANFGIHLMLIDKFLLDLFNLVFNIFFRCTFILHLLNNIWNLINLILHKKLRNSSTRRYCCKWMIIITFIYYWTVIPRSLTLFDLRDRRRYVLTQIDAFLNNWWIEPSFFLSFEIVEVIEFVFVN